MTRIGAAYRLQLADGIGTSSFNPEVLPSLTQLVPSGHGVLSESGDFLNPHSGYYDVISTDSTVDVHVFFAAATSYGTINDRRPWARYGCAVVRARVGVTTIRVSDETCPAWIVQWLEVRPPTGIDHWTLASLGGDF